MSVEDHAGKIILGGVMAVFGAIALGMWGCPQYHVWEQGLSGEAEQKKAEQNRQVLVYQAQAELEASTLKAQAEIERAKGVAGANKIIAEGLKGNE